MAYTDDGNVFSAVVGETNGQTDSAAGGTGETFAIEKGQAITIDQDGLMFLACADTDATQMPCVGIATKRLVHDEMGTFVNRGYIRGVAGLSAPSRVYLSNTPGAFSNSAGDTSQVLGRSYAADDAFYFDPDLSVADDHTAES